MKRETLERIAKRLQAMPEVLLQPVAIDREMGAKCLTEHEEAHVAFDYPMADMIDMEVRDGVTTATCETRQVNLFCANCSPEVAEFIAHAANDIRLLLQEVGRLRGDG